MTNKVCIMMVGLPGSGKSTLAKKWYPDGNVKILSTDDILEGYARNTNSTYDEVFKKHYPDAEREFIGNIKYAVGRGESIILDRTNLTKKSRARLMNMIKSIDFEYKFNAINVSCAFNQILFRAMRPGKSITRDIINRMLDTYVRPSYDEGFTTISVVDTSSVEIENDE